MSPGGKRGSEAPTEASSTQRVTRGADSVARFDPRRTAFEPAMLTSLQKLAGNRAVSSLLHVQRRGPNDPTSGPPSSSTSTSTADATEPLADRLAADRTTMQAADFGDRVWAKYQESGGRVRDVVERLWMDDLELLDVDPGAVSGHDRTAVATFRKQLTTRVQAALKAKLAELTRKVATAEGKEQIRQQVGTTIAGSTPNWGDAGIGDRLWAIWVSTAKIPSSDVPEGAVELWKALAAQGGQAMTTARKETFPAKTAGTVDSTEQQAVEAVLDAGKSWVATAEDMAALTDQVAARLARPTGRETPEWKQLNGRMARLVIGAETAIVNRVLPKPDKATAELWPERWAELREFWVRDITKPIWTYYRDNIVDAEVFGNHLSRSRNSEGLHRDVAQAIKLVEQSALRITGRSSIAELNDNEGKGVTAPGSEFRFEPVSHYEWMTKSRHVSFHGTGRAMDFRGAKNPAFQGNVHELVSVLGGGEQSEQTISRQLLAKWASHMHDVVSLRARLAGQLAALDTPSAPDAEETAGSDNAAARADLTQKIARLDAAIAGQPENDPQASRLRDQATQAYDNIKSMEATFQSSWADYDLKDPELVTKLLAKVDDAMADAKQQIADLKAQPGSHDADLSRLDARLTRMQALRNVLGDKRQTGAQKQLVGAVDKVAQSGITDMPKWLVQAFTEQGWSWGGNWIGFSDAMHFDYMGPVTDTTS